MYLVVLVIVLLAWAVRGAEQGIMWSRTGAAAFKWNEHILFIISRGLFVASLVLCTFITQFQALSVAGCSIHDGVYYIARGMIAKNNGNVNPYPGGWSAEPSTTSTANMDFSWKTRYMLAIGGGIMILFMILSF